MGPARGNEMNKTDFLPSSSQVRSLEWDENHNRNMDKAQSNSPEREDEVV